MLDRSWFSLSGALRLAAFVALMVCAACATWRALPREPGQDSIIVVPRDSIARVDQLESSRWRTAAYIVGAAVVLTVAATA